MVGKELVLAYPDVVVLAGAGFPLLRCLRPWRSTVTEDAAMPGPVPEHTPQSPPAGRVAVKAKTGALPNPSGHLGHMAPTTGTATSTTSTQGPRPRGYVYTNGEADSAVAADGSTTPLTHPADPESD